MPSKRRSRKRSPFHTTQTAGPRSRAFFDGANWRVKWKGITRPEEFPDEVRAQDFLDGLHRVI